MFSGIVADVGEVTQVSPRGAGRTVEIRTRLPVGGEGGIGPGDSVAVMGACLTAEALRPPDRFSVACGAETLARTTLATLRPGARVHLERALRLGDRLDGHLVSGHVDGVGEVVSRTRAAESVVLWVRLPAELCRFVAEKGSICLDGVSLTVNELDGVAFRVNLIPFTTDHTVLGTLGAGDRVNVEVDLLARYLDRLLAPRVAGGLSPERMAALGYGRKER